jgi:hypothetical protein
VFLLRWEEDVRKLISKSQNKDTRIRARKVCKFYYCAVEYFSLSLLNSHLFDPGLLNKLQVSSIGFLAPHPTTALLSRIHHPWQLSTIRIPTHLQVNQPHLDHTQLPLHPLSRATAQSVPLPPPLFQPSRTRPYLQLVQVVHNQLMAESLACYLRNPSVLYAMRALQVGR